MGSGQQRDCNDPDVLEPAGVFVAARLAGSIYSAQTAPR